MPSIPPNRTADKITKPTPPSLSHAPVPFLTWAEAHFPSRAASPRRLPSAHTDSQALPAPVPLSLPSGSHTSAPSQPPASSSPPPSPAAARRCAPPDHETSPRSSSPYPSAISGQASSKSARTEPLHVPSHPSHPRGPCRAHSTPLHHGLRPNSPFLPHRSLFCLHHWPRGLARSSRIHRALSDRLPHRSDGYRRRRSHRRAPNPVVDLLG